MTSTSRIPFRAGGTEKPRAEMRFTQGQAGPVVLLADVSEWEPDVADEAYLQWSKAIVIRCAYGDAHDDRAWYDGTRRMLLHELGARFTGIYQYLVDGQDGAAQARAFRRIVGDIEPGEVFIADFEEGRHEMLTAWYNEMLSIYGQVIRPYLWTYTGLYFGEAQGAMPVEWVAAYGPDEPDSPHKLWQFTSSFPVPGVGRADCSVFHGNMTQLAALAWQEPPAPARLGAPRNLEVRAGDSTVRVTRCDPAPGPAPDHYLISVYTGSYPSPSTLVASYPRFMRAAPDQFGSLQGIASGMHMTLRAVACDADGVAGEYADVHFEMP
jgi:hypothetical protein